MLHDLGADWNRKGFVEVATVAQNPASLAGDFKHIARLQYGTET